MKIIQFLANKYIEFFARLRVKFYSMFLPIGKNTLILKGFEVRNPGGLKIGNNCYVNINFFVQASGRVTIGNDVLIGPGTYIISENHTFGNLKKLIRNQDIEKAPVLIGNNVWIGVGVIILPGVTIGDGCVIAAGAVVTKSFPKNSVIGGVPAKIIKKRVNNA